MGHSDLKTVLDTTLRRQQEKRMLGEKTRILMRDQAACQGAPYTIKTSVNPSWKLGKLFLSPSRLFFIQGRTMYFIIPIRDIVKVDIVEREWLCQRIIRQVRILVSGFNPFYIAVRMPDIWKEAIENQMI